MSKLINIGDIVQALTFNSSCIHDNIIVEFDICLYHDEVLDSGTSKKLRTCIMVWNVPETHYLEFKGITTNIGVSTKTGVLNVNSCGYVHVDVYNSSTQTRNLPSQMTLGSLSLKRYMDHAESATPDDVDIVDEIYLHGGHRHICSANCTRA